MTWPPADHDRQRELFDDDAEPCEPAERRRIDVDLTVLGLDPETVEDDDLRAAAAAASRVLNDRGVTQMGVTSGVAALSSDRLEDAEVDG
jgi:hypothetical protein